MTTPSDDIKALEWITELGESLLIKKRDREHIETIRQSLTRYDELLEVARKMAKELDEDYEFYSEALDLFREFEKKNG